MASLPYKIFQQRHPTYDAPYWRRCRALYAGGKRLLGDDQLLREIFPQHNAEPIEIYRERKRRAYYIPYAGEIVDAIVAALTSEGITMSSEPETSDPFYAKFFRDVSKPGGRVVTLNQLLRHQIAEALQVQTAWTLVDLPDVDPAAYANAKEQEDAGALDAYACPIPAEDVIDWEEDEAGELVWALVRTEVRRRSALEADRDLVTERFTHYTTADWATYEITFRVDSPPKQDAEVALVARGGHSFGKVPLVRLSLPDGLYALGKIESIAVAHLNKRNALEWHQTRTLLAILAAFMAPPDPINPITEDPDRAVSQKYGPGYIAQFGDKDRLEYISPDVAPSEAVAADLDRLRDEMHRVLHHMALSVDNSGAALQRSAESKSIDQAAAAVVLRALGQYVREHAERIYDLVQAGRGDTGTEWSASGMDSFDDAPTSALVEEALTLESVRIPSATFQVRHKLALARRVLGSDASEEDLEVIRKELEASITQDAMALTMDPVGAAAAEAGAVAEATAPFNKPDPKEK